MIEHVGQIDHDLDHLLLNSRSYPAVMTCCARPVQHRSNPGHLSYVDHADLYGCHEATMG